MERYKTRDIIFRNEDKGFLCQNSPCPGSLEKGCPCALLSIWNYLVLEFDAPWQSDDGYMMATKMRNYMIRRFLKGIEKLKAAGLLDEGSNELVRGAMMCINTLSTGIDLKTAPTSNEEFVTTDASLLFGALGIDVVHGNVVDPKALDETTKFSESTSSETSSDGQLTNYGLSLLQCRQEGQLGVLYHNGHYSLLLKHEKILLTLQTDECVLNDLPTAIWKRLTMVDGDSFYLTSRFSPTKDQKNIEKADQWYNQNLIEKFGETKETMNLHQKKGRNIEQ